MSITEVDETSGQRNTLATPLFASTGAMWQVSATVTLRDGSVFALNAGMLDANRNLNVVAFHAGVHVLTATAHWNGVPPSVGFRLPAGTFIELLFERG